MYALGLTITRGYRMDTGLVASRRKPPLLDFISAVKKVFFTDRTAYANMSTMIGTTPLLTGTAKRE